MKRVQQIVEYLNTNPNAVILFRSSDMILNNHSDASYLSAGNSRSQAGGYFFMGSLPCEGKPIHLNSNIAFTCAILKLVASSAAEVELGALFLNTKEARIVRLTLAELGHPQTQTPIHIDNTTAVIILNNTIKRQQSRTMEMRSFWLLEQETNKYSKFYYQPGQEKFGRLPLQGPHRIHTYPRASILLTHGKLNKFTNSRS